MGRGDSLRCHARMLILALSNIIPPVVRVRVDGVRNVALIADCISLSTLSDTIGHIYPASTENGNQPMSTELNEDLVIDLEVYFVSDFGERFYMGTISIKTDRRIFFNQPMDNVRQYSAPPIRIDSGRIEFVIRTRPVKEVDRNQSDA